jgi:hypothetical protein
MIIDYDAVEAAGYKVEHIEENVHIIENFISEKDADFLVSFANSLTNDQWCELNLTSAKKQAFAQFGTDDLELLEKEGKMHFNRYSIDKSVGLINGDMGPSGVDPSILDTASEMRIKFSRRLEKFVADPDKYELSPFFSIRRHYKDDGMPDHDDQMNNPQQRQSVVLYLNDDYNGGELYFRDQKIQVKPKARSVMIFNNGADYMHGVRTVLDGPTRYTLATFISVK